MSLTKRHSEVKTEETPDIVEPPYPRTTSFLPKQSLMRKSVRVW